MSSGSESWPVGRGIDGANVPARGVGDEVAGEPDGAGVSAVVSPRAVEDSLGVSSWAWADVDGSGDGIGIGPAEPARPVTTSAMPKASMTSLLDGERRLLDGERRLLIARLRGLRPEGCNERRWLRHA